MELGKSKEDYLKAIFILQLKLSTVRSKNVAEYLGFSKASVSVAMKQLRSKNYIIMDDGCGLHLSPKGESLASQVYERYIFFTNLLCKMGVPIEIAKKDACLIEHVISTESFDKLKCNLLNCY